MSMPSFYINKTGKKLGDKPRDILEKAKDELHKAFGRAPNNK